MPLIAFPPVRIMPAQVRPLAPTAVPAVNIAAITGAVIDETQAKAVITVTPTTLRAGMQKAHDNLTAGIATKVVLRPGVYRQDLSDLKWDADKARDTLLILEGTPGKTVWTGADVFPLSTWKRQGGLLVHDWPYRFGNAGYPWSPARLIAHRREMAFVGGTALRPQVLETYKIGGLSTWGSSGLSYTYTGLRDPAKTIRPGEFGVTERPENGGRVYLRLPVGLRPREGDIELSVRPVLLDMRGKRRLVIRGIDFVRCANPMVSAVPSGPAEPAPLAFSGEKGPQNILIDRCRFLWNAGSGLILHGQDWTVRDSVFNYNGLSGIAGSSMTNIVFDGDETSFNCWRAWRAGENDWSFGGIKMHGTDGQRVIRHLALGNCSTGLWWDIYCGRVDLFDSVSLANANCDVKYEFSYGPMHGRRLVLGGSKFGPEWATTVVGSSLLEDSVLYHDYDPADHAGNNYGTVVSLFNAKRTDPQAIHPLPGGVQGIQGCILVAGPRTPKIIRAEWWAAPGEASIRFRTAIANNIYYAEHHAPAFQFHLSDGDGLTFSGSAAAFAQQAGDTGSREADPKLRDPANYDFRFAPDSPLYADRARWPQYRLPPAKLAEMRAFFAWLGCPPDGPATPPAGEP